MKPLIIFTLLLLSPNSEKPYTVKEFDLEVWKKDLKELQKEIPGFTARVKFERTEEQ